MIVESASFTAGTTAGVLLSETPIEAGAIAALCSLLATVLGRWVASYYADRQLAREHELEIERLRARLSDAGIEHTGKVDLPEEEP